MQCSGYVFYLFIFSLTASIMKAVIDFPALSAAALITSFVPFGRGY